MAADLGAETEIADVHSMRLPIFDQSIPRDQQPAKLLWLIERMRWADGFLICSPTYLGSLSGAVKNTLDSLHLAHGEPRVYFDGRPVALGSIGYYGQVNTINSLAFVTRVMGATVVAESLAISVNEDSDEASVLATPLVQAQLSTTVEHLLQATELNRDLVEST